MRTSSGPAVKSTAHKGRTNDRNLLRSKSLKKTLAKPEPSTNDTTLYRQIVTIEQALQLRDRAVRLPARRDDAFKKAAREEDRGAQGRLDV